MLGITTTFDFITNILDIFAPSEDTADYLAPELDADILTDVDGNILCIGATVHHVDGGTGTILAIGDSPYYVEDFLTAYVVWKDEGADHFAGHVLRLAVA